VNGVVSPGGPGSPPLAPDGGAAVADGVLAPLRVTELPDEVGLRLAGEIDIETGPLLSTALEQFAVTHERICLELSEVTFVDVAGARVLVRAAQHLDNGRRLVLRHPPGPLLLILEFFPQAGLQIDPDAQIETEER
jgi:anti-anti-sigma factor